MRKGTPVSLLAPSIGERGAAGVQDGAHLEIQGLGGTDAAPAAQLAEGGRYELDVLDGGSIGRHVNGGGERLDLRIRSGLDAGQLLDRGHLRSQIEAGEARVAESQRAVDDQSFDRTREGEFGAGVAALERRPRRQLDAEGRQHGSELRHGHLGPRQVHIHRRGFALRPCRFR